MSKLKPTYPAFSIKDHVHKGIVLFLVDNIEVRVSVDSKGKALYINSEEGSLKVIPRASNAVYIGIEKDR